MRRLLVAMGVALMVALGATATAGAAQLGERITSYEERIVIQQDASLLVTEKISYDFGSVPHHGIFRDIPVRFDYEPDRRYERVTKIDEIKVTAEPAGTSGKTAVENAGRLLRIKIGDAKKTVTGVHDYTISYRVRGAI